MTAVQRLKDKAAQQELERKRAGAEAVKAMQLIDRFMRIVGNEPIKMNDLRLARVWDVIERWNEKSFPRAVPDEPLQKLTLYGLYNNPMAFFGVACGIRSKFGPGESRPITEDKVLERIVERLSYYGVPEDVLERAELQARKEQNDQAVAKVKVEQSENRMRHTIAALALDVGSHEAFKAMAGIWSTGGCSFLDIQMAVRDIGAELEKQFGHLWESDDRDFIIDIENAASRFVKGSVDSGNLMSPGEVVAALKSSDYLTYGDLLDAVSKDSMDQTVTVSIDGEFHPVKQVATTTDTDVLDAGHLVLKVSEDQ